LPTRPPPAGKPLPKHAKGLRIYFIDLKMPGGPDGIETMMEIKKLHEEASIIIITAYATVDTAITAMKEGAQEYIVQTLQPYRNLTSGRADHQGEEPPAREQNPAQKAQPQYSFEDIISKNPRCTRSFS